MCKKNYQDSCYHHCILYSKCNFHRIEVCDHCGKRIPPGQLIIVNDRYIVCSEEHANLLVNRKLNDWENLMFSEAFQR